ncbi:MAG: hypothetical protein V1753_10170 [Pseudomonadota bacterium]
MATVSGDIVLVFQEERPSFFARVEDIQPDQRRGWYQVKLLVLQVPLSEVTWILRKEYIQGVSFTMGGERVRLQRVEGRPAVKKDLAKVIPLYLCKKEGMKV